METQIFHHAKHILIFKKKKNPLKRNQNPSRYIKTLITNNLKFQHKPKKVSSFKNPHILKKKKKRERPIIIFPGGQNPLSYYTL